MKYYECIHHYRTGYRDEIYGWCALSDDTCPAEYGYHCEDMEEEE